MATQLPDDVLIHVLQAHGKRSEARAVQSHWRSLIEDNFEIRKYEPPVNKTFCIDFEIDCQMAKDLYCAQFGGTKREAGSLFGDVTFSHWVPAYFRSRLPQDILHEIGEDDACELWKTISKVRDVRDGADANTVFKDEVDGGADATPRRRANSEGHLIVSEGDAGVESGFGKRQVIGRLSTIETELVLRVIDHRRNGRTRRCYSE